MAAKKKSQIPKIVSDKIEFVKSNDFININIIDDNRILIAMDNHEIHHYLRHRNGRFSVYDPLGKYKNEIIKRIKYILLNDNKLNSIVEFNKDNPVVISIKVKSLPPRSNSMKVIFYKMLGSIYNVRTPDIDNYQKTIFDICNKVLWTDDAQIFKVIAEKSYSDKPYTEFEIEYKIEDPSLSKGSIKASEYKDKKRKALYEYVRKYKMGDK